MTTLVCPITNELIDENLARLNAITALTIIALSLIFNLWWLMIFLNIDFFTSKGLRIEELKSMDRFKGKNWEGILEVY